MNKIIIDSDNEIIINDNSSYDIEIVSDSNLVINVLKDITCNVYIHSIDKKYNVNIDYNLDDNSTLIINKFSFNDNLCVNENINLNGINSSIKYNFSSIVSSYNYSKIKIFHNNLNCSSYIYNRSIGNDGSEVIFDIDSIVEKGNNLCVMDQNSKIMCFGDVNAKISPNMYIDEEDVEARHGSVVGKFSDDDIFYIMSRGINYSDTIKLLIKGFILSNLGLDDERKKDIIDIIEDYYK